MKEEVESVHLKDDTSFKEIVRQEQARRRLKGQQPKEKLTVAVKHWQVMRMLEELQETFTSEQEYSVLIKEHGFTFPPEVCSQLELYEGQEVKIWVVDKKTIVLNT